MFSLILMVHVYYAMALKAKAGIICSDLTPCLYKIYESVLNT